MSFFDGIKERKSTWQKLADSMTCGLCDNITTRHSQFSCGVCGRMLCDKCGIKPGRCKDHPKEIDVT